MRVQPRGQGLQVELHHSVELHGLARREADAAVGEVAGDVVEGEPLRRVQTPAGDGHADHEDVLEGLARQGALAARIAIVLGVDAVELEQVLRGPRQVRFRRIQVRRQVAAQAIGAALDPFLRDECRCLLGHHVVPLLSGIHHLTTKH